MRKAAAETSVATANLQAGQEQERADTPAQAVTVTRSQKSSEFFSPPPKALF